MARESSFWQLKKLVAIMEIEEDRILTWFNSMSSQRKVYKARLKQSTESFFVKFYNIVQENG